MSHVHVRRLNWVVVLQPTGALLGDPAIDELRRTIQSVLQEQYQGVVLNLAHAETASSMAMAVIVEGFQAARHHGTKMAICLLTARLSSMFDTAGIRLSPFATEEEAIRWCSSR